MTPTTAEKTIGAPEKWNSESRIPIIHSFMVLRREQWGGYAFNPYLPPELRLDSVRFQILSLCDGRHRVRDIKCTIGKQLRHSQDYVDLLVDKTLGRFEGCFAIYWREDRLDTPVCAVADAKFPLDESGARQLSAPLFVIWEITGRCNLRCRHCLSDSGKPCPGELNTVEAKRLIDAFVAMKVFNVSFSGGEPLLRPDFFEILEHASAKNLGIELLTNGTLVTKDVVSRLSTFRIFNVQVSLDGIAATHDEFRGIVGCYERALTAIRMLREAGFEVVISTTVTSRNVSEIPEIIDLAAELGAAAYKTTFFMATGRGEQRMDEYLLTPQMARDFAFRMIAKKEEMGDRIVINNEMIYPWLTGVVAKPDEARVHDSARVGCTAGNSSCYITPEGRVTPCPFLRSFVAGDIRRDALEAIWKDSPVFDIFRNIRRGDLHGKCADCEMLGRECYGGCRAGAFAQTGDICGEDPLCWK